MENLLLTNLYIFSCTTHVVNDCFNRFDDLIPNVYLLNQNNFVSIAANKDITIK